jgi:hypothetical protein
MAGFLCPVLGRPECILAPSTPSALGLSFSSQLTMYERSAYYNSINIYNKLPDDPAELVLNKKLFLIQLKKISN